MSLAELSPVEPEKKKHHFTFGELVFDAGVYGGVGYIANTAISLTVAHQAKNIPTSKLNEYYNASFDAISNGLRKFKHDENDIARWAGRINDYAFLSSGGWALLVPIKWMEDYMAQIVGAIDHTFHTGPAYGPEHPLKDDSPKQSYLSLFGGRFLTYPLIAAISEPILTYMGGEKAIMHTLDKRAGSFFNRFSEPEQLRKLAATEFTTAATGTVLLYSSSHVIAYADHLIKKGLKSEKPTPQIEHPDYEERLFGNETTQQTARHGS